MGVSGCGKTTLGRLVARELGCEFVEGDSYHPPENVEKMRSGQPLDDNDRAGWLEALARVIARHREDATTTHLCLSCSALKREYRDVLRRGDPDLAFIFMQGRREVLERYVSEREHEYMPPGLLDSQLEALEVPGPEEWHLVTDIELPPDEQAAAVVNFVKKSKTTG